MIRPSVSNKMDSCAKAAKAAKVKAAKDGGKAAKVKAAKVKGTFNAYDS